ncbi:hypothetical protein HHK36_005996 [Tetracentron sinense]|uniref:HSF-type DNA-binding domain-containing protein n=1 Tax=Tetracentron sinense TaxID=13715 RepID=A0A834ZJK8_TETSI|nr:hypothetical protein HHK36_005996 [Tetracentron sinense]
MEEVSVKKDEEEMMVGASSAPKALEGLKQTCTTPLFLTKTFDMVDNPATNSLVSWSYARNSFIVWDSHKFSIHLLPKYFKHSNFSSFIRQLNIYGFRKVHPDQWEFANEWFLGGEKHLLKNIKRRNASRNKEQQGLRSAHVELGQFGLEEELERLRSDRDILMVENAKLRQKYQNSQDRLVAIEKRLQCTLKKQQKMMAFLARALKSPTFVQRLMRQNEYRRELGNGGNGKKPRLPASRSTENLQGEAIMAATSTSQISSNRNQTQEEPATLESEIETLFSATMDDELTMESEVETLFSATMDDESNSSIYVQKDNMIPGTATLHLGSFTDKTWEELVTEDLIVGTGEEEVVADQSEFDLAVEDWL